MGTPAYLTGFAGSRSATRVQERKRRLSSRNEKTAVSRAEGQQCGALLLRLALTCHGDQKIPAPYAGLRQHGPVRRRRNRFRIGQRDRVS